MPPRTIGTWEITAVIGRGGIGTVYRARHRGTGEPAAVKLLGPPPAVDPTAARRLAREYEALRDLDHPNVVRVFEAGVCECYGYLAMELVEGLDLRSYLSADLDDPGGGAVAWSEGTPSDGGAAAYGLEAWSLEPATDEHGPAGERPARLSGPDAIRAFAEVLEEPETDESSGEFAPRSAAPDSEDAGPDDVPPLPPHRVERLNRPARLRRPAEALAPRNGLRVRPRGGRLRRPAGRRGRPVLLPRLLAADASGGEPAPLQRPCGGPGPFGVPRHSAGDPGP